MRIPEPLLKPGVVELPVRIGSFELIVVSGVVERQFAIAVPRVRVRTSLKQHRHGFTNPK